MFNTQFSKSNQWSQICQVRSLQVRPSPTSGYVIFSKTYMTHVLHPIFQEKSTGNDLRYVRGPQVMPIDVNNVNQAESSTCGTWPGWRCQRGWAWLGGPLTYLGHSQSISLEKLDIKHVLCLFLKIWRTHLWYLAWLTLSPSMSLTWRPLTYLRPFSVDFSWKIGYKTCVIYVFGKFDKLAVVLPLVVFIDVDGVVYDAKSGCANSCLRSAGVRIGRV